MGSYHSSSNQSSSSHQSSSFGSSSSFQGLSDSDQASVRALIKQLLGGGTTDYKALRAKRMANMANLQALARDYTNDAAFSDAADLMKLNLQSAMEKQMPAIAKAVQGAGTSSSSMQALMSNKIAQDAALASGALGAEQAKAYGQIQATMQNILENYTRGEDTTAQNLIQALGLLRTATSKGSQQSQSTGSSIGSGSSSGWQSAIGGGSSGGYSGGSRAPSSSGSLGGGWSNSGSYYPYYGDYLSYDSSDDGGYVYYSPSSNNSRNYSFGSFNAGGSSYYQNYDPGYGYSLGTPGYYYSGSGQEYGADYLNPYMTYNWGGGSSSPITSWNDLIATQPFQQSTANNYNKGGSSYGPYWEYGPYWDYGPTTYGGGSSGGGYYSDPDWDYEYGGESFYDW